MRFFVATLLLLLAASVASADAECEAVKEHSMGHIECTRDEFGYTLRYDGSLSRLATLMSGQYDEMIATLCAAGGIVKETWYKPFKGMQLRVTHCVGSE